MGNPVMTTATTTDSNNGAWIEDRMFGVKTGEPRQRRPIPDGEAPETVIAEWMLSIFRKTGGLTQKQAIWGIRELFGPDYLQASAHGRATIPRAVLNAFRKLDPEGIVWSTHQRAWRPRRPDDPPERRNVL